MSNNKDNIVVVDMDSRHLTPVITIKYHADIPRLSKIGEGSDWVDMYAAETVDLKAGEYRRISLGVSMELPAGYEAHVVPRSSTFERYGIIMPCETGIIDNSYRGDNDIWQFPALAMRDTHIEMGDRICQFRIMQSMGDICFLTVDKLSGANRGGFGSTGER